jgi:hypothetical protein
VAPEIAKQWHPTRNGKLTPESVSAGSRKRVWWLCSRNSTHEWQAGVEVRARAKTQCPQCAKATPLPEQQTLAEFDPVLAEQWHATKNIDVTPATVTRASNYRAWWVCPLDASHVWQASVRNRSKLKQGCPYCAPRTSRVSPGKSLADKFPDIAREWHPTKNDGVVPTGVLPGSSKRVWWQCKINQEHVWDGTITGRTHRRSKGQCPFCSGARVTDANSLQQRRPDIAKEWHPTRNAPLTPDQIKRASHQLIWWQCSVDPNHEWKASVKNRTVLGSGCPHCNAENRVQRLQAALLESAEANVDYFSTFKLDMQALRSLAKLPVPEYRKQRHTFFRMLYSSGITALETYLSDAFYHNVIGSDVLLERLMGTTPEFRERKYSLSEIVEWSRNLRQKVSEYLFDIVWHNLAKVRQMYDTVLDVKFPEDASAVHRSVMIRHDLVHRNGKTKARTMHRFSSHDIEILFTEIETFVQHVDTQLHARRHSENPAH